MKELYTQTFLYDRDTKRCSVYVADVRSARILRQETLHLEKALMPEGNPPAAIIITISDPEGL